MSDKLVQVEHLRQYFPAGGFGKNKKYVQAVDDVSFYINKILLVGNIKHSWGSHDSGSETGINKSFYLHYCF